MVSSVGPWAFLPAERTDVMMWACISAFMAGFGVGFATCFLMRRIDSIRWRTMAIEMARVNNELMDRMDLLESERQRGI